LPTALLEYFSSDRLAVSAPVLAAATLEPAQWRAILAAADDETRRFIETLHPEIRADLTETLVEAPAEESPPSPASPSLHEVVQRIERRRRTRATMQRRAGTSSTGEGVPTLFRWECGAGGEIAWVEGAPRGALIGRSIARPQDSNGDRLDPGVVRAFMLRAPFRDGTLSVGGDGLLSGEWKISGVPAFEPSDGRFAGYRGIALRGQDETTAAEPQADVLSDPDSLRELVHEIKTPLNAIIGFAEIIEGQYLGPADRRYRERAQEIVREARLLLTAIDDLDFAAKVHSSAESGHKVELCELLDRAVAALGEVATGCGVELERASGPREAVAVGEPELAERLIVRMCSAVIEQARGGERLRLSVELAGQNWRVSITRPDQLRSFSEEELLGSSAPLDRSLSLRLARGLARIAGGDLIAPQGTISLVFPRA
jgi:hypothetical protein